MAAFPISLLALTSPPQAVALSDRPEFASMALVALVLAAVSIAARRPHRHGHGHRVGGHGADHAVASTRARS
jgi:hypothetical protein